MVLAAGDGDGVTVGAESNNGDMGRHIEVRFTITHFVLVHLCYIPGKFSML